MKKLKKIRLIDNVKVLKAEQMQNLVGGSFNWRCDPYACSGPCYKSSTNSTGFCANTGEMSTCSCI